jgi:hypothetical protein
VYHRCKWLDSRKCIHIYQSKPAAAPEQLRDGSSLAHLGFAQVVVSTGSSNTAATAAAAAAAAAGTTTTTTTSKWATRNTSCHTVIGVDASIAKCIASESVEAACRL